VRGVDEVMGKRLIHIIAEIKFIGGHNGIIIAHQIPGKGEEDKE